MHIYMRHKSVTKIMYPGVPHNTVNLPKHQPTILILLMQATVVKV